MTKKQKMPAILFYTGDWLKDPAVRCCSLKARGLWIDMLCLMYESPTRGHLSLASGKPVDSTKLARMVGGVVQEVDELLEELYECGVFSKSEHGIIFSRRMVQDEIIREQKSRAGSTGMHNRYQKDDSVISQPVTEVQQMSNTTSNRTLTPLEIEYETENESVIETLIETNIVLRDKSEKNSSQDFIDSRKARELGDNPVGFVIDAIPKNRINNPEQTRLQIQRILNVIEESGNSVKYAAEQLAKRFALYYKSEEGKGNRFKYPHTWLQDGCYLVDPIVWDSRKKKIEIKFPENTFDQDKIIRLYCEMSSEKASKIRKRKERGDEDSSIAHKIWEKFPDILNRSKT